MKNIFGLVLIMLVVGVGLYVIDSQPVEAPSDEIVSAESSLTNPLAEPKYETISTDVVYAESATGYLATPAGEGPFPALVLIHEWWGLNQNIKDLADDFAAQGYVALAVDLYGGSVATTPEEAGKLAGAVRADVDAAFANLSAATDYLASLPTVSDEQIASVGWCFGGQWAYNMAANNMGIAASVMYYGRFSMDDDLSMMRADILGHFGEEDTSIAVDDVRQFEAKLKTLDGEHAVFIYPNAGHAFANEDNEAAYNEEAAVLAWQHTLDFLQRQLGQ